MFLAAVGYPLAVAHLTAPQLNSIQAPMVAVLLNKMGFSRRFPRAITFGPSFHGGVGLEDLQIHQGIKAIQLLMTQLRVGGQPCRMLHITLSWAQINAGVGFPLLEGTARCRI